MSQRSFSAVVVFVVFIVVGVFAYLKGIIPPLSTISAEPFVILTPLVFVFTTLNAWFDTVDSMVADGSLKPGELTPLFTMTPFYITMVSCLSGILQVFGIRVLDAETQTILVNALLVVATVLLRSFTSRPPTSTQKVVKA